ncbi:hypothetical protein X759_20545 [Mesorhizobium sp. LSHC420B00]|nr:hypothetical protein X759_20545 [Mesorhizobium sp. LSHC420B00]
MPVGLATMHLDLGSECKLRAIVSVIINPGK